MIHNKNQSGFILVMTLLMISLGMLITSSLFDRGSSYTPFAHAVIDRQKAIFLAYSGLALTESQLLHPAQTEKEKQEATTESKTAPKPPTDQEDMQQLLTTLLPVLNKWQTFIFTDERDGIDGTLKICIMSEDGKLNINKLYDFKTKKFKDETAQGGGFKTIIAGILGDIEKTMQTKELFASLQRYLEKRDYPLNDVTELLTIKAFDVFRNAIYYQPSESQKEQKGKERSRTYALTDLFTTISDDAGVNPWVLSESMRAALQIPPSTATIDSKQTEQFAQVIKQFKMQNQWPQEWDTSLKNIYGIEYSRLPKYTNIAVRASGLVRYFSVLIHSTVGDATQQLYVILERIKKSQDNKTVYQIVIRSYYWL
ncbi:MAG TPA: hypothetical protein VGW78_04400 [Candidatus Babeliales bacterium]|jgi:hypothetical protein|nr:hypothetical protein [Candidatus Babeliales bacterium]